MSNTHRELADQYAERAAQIVHTTEKKRWNSQTLVLARYSKATANAALAVFHELRAHHTGES